MREKPNLDLLRSLAIVLVCYSHLKDVMGTNRAYLGFLGVYIFFVHTCLVLMWSLERKPHTLDFYIRRAFRIYPLAMAVVLIIVVFNLPMYNSGPTLFAHYRDFHPHLLLGTIENLLLSLNRSGGIVLFVMWSLPLEVFMYILLPCLFFFIRKNFRLWPLLIFWALAMNFTTAAGGNGFVNMIPCFLPGVMAYVLYARTKPRLPAWAFVAFLAVAVAIFAHYCSNLPGAVRAGWSICLVLGLSLPQFKQVRSRALNRITHEVAKYSYGAYLTHMFAYCLAFHVLALRPAWAIPLSVVLTTSFSMAGYHLIEKPLIDLGAKLAVRVSSVYEKSDGFNFLPDATPLPSKHLR
jgi:peptidoglycan/LPS O-acetylase OafA/YrhL